MTFFERISFHALIVNVYLCFCFVRVFLLLLHLVVFDYLSQLVSRCQPMLSAVIFIQTSKMPLSILITVLRWKLTAYDLRLSEHSYLFLLVLFHHLLLSSSSSFSFVSRTRQFSATPAKARYPIRLLTVPNMVAQNWRRSAARLTPGVREDPMSR